MVGFSKIILTADTYDHFTIANAFKNERKKTVDLFMYMHWWAAGIKLSEKADKDKYTLETK